MTGFCWHPRARLFDSVGQPVARQTGGGGQIAEQPAAAALAQALALPGQPFRIGGPGPAPSDPGCFETLTSGSSGQPRRILRTQASWYASFAVNAGLFGIGPGVAVAVLGRLVQSLALYAAVEALCLGADLHLLTELRPDRQRRALAQRQVQVLYAAPAQLRLLAEVTTPDLPALRLIVVGGSKLDEALRARLARLAPNAAIREFYGAAETSFITLADASTPAAAVGRAYPGVQIDIRNGAGRSLPEGARGEIWVQSPYLFRGYAGGDPGGARWAQGWLSVGEIGWLQQGQLYLAGRAGRMVTIADQNVFPEEIESYMAALPGIEQVAVLPRPDPLRGVVLLAVARGDPAQEAAILAAARAHLGPLQAPRAMIWRSDWPLLASGKVDLQVLAQEIGA